MVNFGAVVRRVLGPVLLNGLVGQICYYHRRLIFCHLHSIDIGISSWIGFLKAAA